MRPRRLEDVDCADDVHLGVERRLGDRDTNVGLGGEVEARLRLRLRERARDGVRIADVRLDEAGALADVLAPAACEVVEHPDVVAALDERVHDMRADEASSACYERPHGALS